MAQTEKVLARVDADLDKSLERLFALLRIKSISADPHYKKDCREGANFCARLLNDIGIEASVRNTIGHPMVVGHYRGAGDGAPHVLFYGHYDVQPVDPVSLWDRDPFDPAVVDVKGEKQIVGRGADDDKGQLMTFVEAARAWTAVAGKLPVNLTVLIEGEEESASPSMVPFLTENRAELKADIALVCDTNMWNRATPAVTTMLRGLLYEEVIIDAASRDLHSGYYGSAARNPIHVLVSILTALHDENGRVTIPHFYDGVPEVSAAQKAEWASLDFDEKAFLGDIGLEDSGGREGLFHARAGLGAPDRGGERYRRRLHGRRREDRHPGESVGESLLSPCQRPEPRRDPGEFPRLREGAAAGRLQGELPQPRRRPRRLAAERQPLGSKGAARALRRMGPPGRADRDGRLYPDRHPVQAHPRYGRRHGRVWA